MTKPGDIECPECGHKIVREYGPFYLEFDDKDRPVVQSNDFTFDVRLHASGDFPDRQTKIVYMNEIARALNNWFVHKRKEGLDIPILEEDIKKRANVFLSFGGMVYEGKGAKIIDVAILKDDSVILFADKEFDDSIKDLTIEKLGDEGIRVRKIVVLK